MASTYNVHSLFLELCYENVLVLLLLLTDWHCNCNHFPKDIEADVLSNSLSNYTNPAALIKEKYQQCLEGKAVGDGIQCTLSYGRECSKCRLLICSAQ